MSAELSINESYCELALQRLFPHPRNQVWQSITDPQSIAQWFPCTVKGRWETGAALAFEFADGKHADLPASSMRGEVFSVNPKEHVRFSWGEQLYRYQLIAQNGSCQFTLTDQFADPSTAARGAAGWEMCLDNLARVLAGQTTHPFNETVWQQWFEHYVQSFEAAAGPQQGMPD